jgi:hypothetical protein
LASPQFMFSTAGIGSDGGPLLTVRFTVVPLVTPLPSAGSWSMTWLRGWEPSFSLTSSPTVKPAYSRMARASSRLRPTTPGTCMGKGPFATYTVIALWGGWEVPIAGSVEMT